MLYACCMKMLEKFQRLTRRAEDAVRAFCQQHRNFGCRHLRNEGNPFLADPPASCGAGGIPGLLWLLSAPLTVQNDSDPSIPFIPLSLLKRIPGSVRRDFAVPSLRVALSSPRRGLAALSAPSPRPREASASCPLDTT